MPWLILFGLGAYFVWKEHEKKSATSAQASPPPAVQDVMSAPPQDAPQDAPQDGGAPAPSGGASGGGGYADPGPSPEPAPGIRTEGTRAGLATNLPPETPTTLKARIQSGEAPKALDTRVAATESFLKASSTLSPTVLASAGPTVNVLRKPTQKGT